MRSCALLAAMAAAAISSGALAGQGAFVYTQTLDRPERGHAALSQEAEYRPDRGSSPDTLALAEKVTYSPADNFALGAYLPRWHIAEDDSHFDSAAVQGLLAFSDPVTDAVGLGIAAEAGIGDNGADLQARVIAQKEIGNWNFAYNLSLARWENRSWESGREGVSEVGHYFGLGYGLSSFLRAGAELTVNSVYESAGHYDHTSVYAGPTLGIQGGKFFGTRADWWFMVTPMFQVTVVEEEPSYKIGMLLGIEL